MVEGFLAKFSESKRSELSKEYGVLWELDHEIIKCRFCSKYFTLLYRKHHCRYCGGIFCLDCCCYDGGKKSGGGNRLQCKYCYLGYSPSTTLLETHKSISQYSSITNFLSGDAFIRLNQPKLECGSLYDDNFVRPIGEIAHISGYFQITNRAELKCCAVKLVSEGCNLYHEIFRPPYLPIPPKESIYSLIGSYKFLYIIILYDNPFPTTDGMSVVYTSRIGDEISPCASPKFFRKFAVYKVNCRNKNVLLKFTEENKIELRSGQGRRIKYKAVGIFSEFMKSMSSSTLSGTSSSSSSSRGGNSDKINQRGAGGGTSGGAGAGPSGGGGAPDSLITAATLDYETNIDNLEVVVMT